MTISNTRLTEGVSQLIGVYIFLHFLPLVIIIDHNCNFSLGYHYNFVWLIKK